MTALQSNLEDKGIADAYYYRLARFLFIIVAIVALGIFIINSVIDYRYKVVFIKSPCALCQELNPEVKECFTIRNNLFPDGKGGWRYENGTPVDAIAGAGLQPSFSLPQNFSIK
jgi:hypothetical protein